MEFRTIKVYASEADEVSKKLDKLAKKADKYGVAFGYIRGEEHPTEVSVYKFDPATCTIYKAETFTAMAVDFQIADDELIKQNGWTVVAKLEHGEAGNIVTPLGGAEVDKAWYTAEARCDHCNTNRFRAVTYIVEKDGERKQVGNSCLKDYTGISPMAAALWAEVSAIDLTENGLDNWECRGSKDLMHPTEHIIALACDMVKKFGYRKSDAVGSTKQMVIDNIKTEPSAEGKAKAAKIVEWLAGINEHTCWNDLEWNCSVLVKSGYAKNNHVGRLAYMPIAYDKMIERQAEKEAEAKAEAESQYVGVVGDRLTVNTKSAEFLTSWETMYGATYLYKFTDTDGNVFIWKASSPQDITKNGLVIKGTVKEHSEFNGTKQTVLTRCKVA